MTLNTIASIGSINTPFPQTVISSTEPTTRASGAPLQEGDRWYNPDDDGESIYYNGKWEPIISLDTEVINNIITTRRQSISRISSATSAKWLPESPPTPDPNGRPGWYFASDGNKIQWDLWQQPITLTNPLKFEDMVSASIVVRSTGSKFPYFSIYTQPKLDGMDATLTYRSRYTYEFIGTDPNPNNATKLLTTRNNNPIYGDLNHLQLVLNPASSVGPQQPDEVVKNVTLGTSSGAGVGVFDFLASEFSVDTKTEMFTVLLEANDAVDDNAARMYYQATSPGLIGRKVGDFWYDSTNSQLKIWSGTGWVDV